MTVEIDQAALMRAQTMSNGSQLPIGTPSIMSLQNSSPAGVSSPTTSMMSIPIGNGSIINKKADPAQGLYQTCLTLRERLRDVPDFEKFLEPPEDADPDIPEDPVTQLWRCFRMGSSLCVLFNACRPVELIQDARLSPNLKTLNDCKAATFHFLKGIKQELMIDGDDAFMIHNLYSDDTNGFVKVTKTVSKILDILKQRNLLLNRGSSDQPLGSGDKQPLDNRARVVQELVDTERKYVQDLEALQDYMRCLESNEVISRDLIHNMFLNLNQLVDFQRRFLIRVETQNDLPAEVQNWGKLFMQYEKSFAVYEPYAANFNAAQNLAQDEREKLARMPHAVCDQLGAFLIKPVQRITKYPLLLRDLIKNTDPAEAAEKQLPEGLEAIERITTQINEAIRKSENVDIVKDLEGRVEDWKGHKLDHFGELLLHGQFTVIKGDAKGEVEREYMIYLFERILLCCKDVSASKKSNKTMSMGKASKASAKKKSNLQLKGRIFMQNVTDVISFARNGSYTLQIFWKGDPGVENFVIKHNNDEGLNLWKKTLQKQREQYQKEENGARGRGSGSGNTAVQFAWMQTDAANDNGDRTSDASDDEEEEVPGLNQTDGYTSQFTASRNGSSTNLRSRSATNERMPQPVQLPQPTVPSVADPYRGLPRFPHPAMGHAPPLTVNTAAGLNSASHSPERNNGSYFSPVGETPLTSRTSSSSNAYPFPRQPTPNGLHYDENRYTPPSMSRTPSREGSTLTPTTAYGPASRGMQQRPSLPGMGNAAAAQQQQQLRMRSASSPNIHHLPNQTRSPGGAIPAVPPVPQGYVAYTGGPAKINRSDNSSPTSPGLPIQGTSGRTLSPTGTVDSLQDLSSLNGSATPSNGSIRSTQSQVKVKIHFNNDKLAIIVPYGIPYSQLMDRVEHKVRRCGNSPEFGPPVPIRIRYQDEDGDYISMNSDDDVQMAFDVACDPAQKDSTGTCGAITLYVQLG